MAEQRDLAALEKVLSVEKDPFMIARYTFYLARSYRDIGEDRKALELYLQRADLGHWDEEIYVSLLNAARLTEQLDEPVHKVLSLYDRAIRTCPTRAEARHGAIQVCNRNKEYAVGFQYGNSELSPEIPCEGIAIIPWIYTYGLREEFSICAYHAGEYRVCLSACFDILGEGEVPGDVLSRTADLARKALTKMVDPVWGSWQPSYSAEVIPAWQI
jgi:tetratricopeptide (TPR) repeat protein